MTSEGMAEMVAGMEHGPVAFGANCGVGASDLLRTVHGLADKADRLIVAKGNAGIPKYVKGQIHYDGTPEVMAQYALLARDVGASVIGGCCGTMPVHLCAMREVLDSQPKGPKPTLDEITEAMGGFSSVSDGTGDGPKPERVRRGRR